MLHYAAFHLGLHCLSQYPLRGSGPQRVNSTHLDLYLVNTGTLTKYSLYRNLYKLPFGYTSHKPYGVACSQQNFSSKDIQPSEVLVV